MALSHTAIRSRLCAILRVEPEQVTFRRDDTTAAERVELLLQDAQMEWALRDNARLVRQAAMDLGIDIEIGAADTGARADGGA